MTPQVWDLLSAGIRLGEGRRPKPYMDTVGKITIGEGWNLTDRGLPDDVIDHLKSLAMIGAWSIAETLYPALSNFTPHRQAALLELAYNLEHRLAGFKKMNAAITAGQWDVAASELASSKWAAQVGKNRSQRLRAALVEG